MGSTVVLPSLTNQMILSAFKFLVEAEVQKQGGTSGALSLWQGNQDGYVTAVCDFFGEADEGTARKAFENEGSWLQVTEKIVETKLSDWVVIVQNAESEAEIDYDKMRTAVSDAVEEYGLEHPEQLIDALKHFL